MLPLPPDYYRRHFARVVAHVSQYRQPLIDAVLVDWLRRYQLLSVSAQCLYLRLLSRKGPWFRLAKLRYDEVGDCSSAIDELIANGFVNALTELNLEQIGKLFTVAELSELLQYQGNKTQLLAQAQRLIEQPLSYWLPADRVIQPLGQSQWQQLQLLFFGNGRQSLTDLLLSDIGQQRFVDYPIEPHYQPWQSALQLRRYQQLQQLEQQWHDGQLALADGLQQLAEVESSAALERKRQRLLVQLARQLERQGDWPKALTSYQQCQCEPARERRLRMLFQQQQYRDAQHLALAMHAAPQSSNEAAVALRFLHRLQRLGWCQLNLPSMPRPIQRTAHLRLNDQPIEQQVIQQLALQGAQAWHCENRLIPTIAALMLWPVLFAPVAGAFVQPFQAAPLDLYSELFIPRRRSLYEQQLAQLASLSSAQFCRQLQQRYQQLRHYSCSLLHGDLDEALIKAALSGLTPQQWTEIVRFLFSDLRQLRAGMPDLWVQFDNRLLLVEVKGPTDQLRENQRHWLTKLQQLAVPARVLNLTNEPASPLEIQLLH